MLRSCAALISKGPYNPFRASVRCLTSVPPTEDPSSNVKTSGYAKAFNKFESMKEADNVQEKATFATLLRHSKFIDLGDPDGKVVTGTIFHVVEDDLYIDFGWKFHCVCTRPKKNSSAYKRGSKVRILIKQLELSSKFLGYEKDLTLLEADCVLLGLVQERNIAAK